MYRTMILAHFINIMNITIQMSSNMKLLTCKLYSQKLRDTCISSLLKSQLELLKQKRNWLRELQIKQLNQLLMLLNQLYRYPKIHRMIAKIQLQKTLTLPQQIQIRPRQTLIHPRVEVTRPQKAQAKKGCSNHNNHKVAKLHKNIKIAKLNLRA